MDDSILNIKWLSDVVHKITTSPQSGKKEEQNQQSNDKGTSVTEVCRYAVATSTIISFVCLFAWVCAAVQHTTSPLNIICHYLSLLKSFTKWTIERHWFSTNNRKRDKLRNGARIEYTYIVCSTTVCAFLVECLAATQCVDIKCILYTFSIYPSFWFVVLCRK